MVQDDELVRELAELRAEIEALKAAPGRHMSASETEGGETVGDLLRTAAARYGGQDADYLQDLEIAVRDLAAVVESDIAKHPVASVGAAFLLGVLLGRLSAR
jgi:ElaB/YqjD/DUF883 family membrane-anchored ribosome-binding protein